MAVYANGRPVVSARAAGACWPVQRVWRNRFPRAVVETAVSVAFGRADRFCTPPAGESFVVDGRPYATPDEFIDCLVEELSQALRRHVAGEVKKVLT